MDPNLKEAIRQINEYIDLQEDFIWTANKFAAYQQEHNRAVEVYINGFVKQVAATIANVEARLEKLEGK